MKFRLITAMLLVLILVMTGCGGKKSNTETPSTSPTPAVDPKTSTLDVITIKPLKPAGELVSVENKEQVSVFTRAFDKAQPSKEKPSADASKYEVTMTIKGGIKLAYQLNVEQKSDKILYINAQDPNQYYQMTDDSAKEVKALIKSVVK